MRASAVLAEAAVAALRAIPELALVQEGAPIQAGVPHAVVETGPEALWGGTAAPGRELRLIVTLRDRGESAARIHRLAGAAEAQAMGLEGPLPGWRLISLHLVAGRTARDAKGWTARLEWRARLLAA
jgi:hypothetical protein